MLVALSITLKGVDLTLGGVVFTQKRVVIAVIVGKKAD